MTPRQITLERTGDRPVAFTGNLTKSFASPNATYAGKETSSRQWILIDLYQTIAGTQIAHIRYRAGSKLGREQPKDLVITGKTLVDLFDAVKLLDPVEAFVTPRDHISQKASPEDAVRWHETACRYAKSEFSSVLNKFSHHVTQHGGVEEII